MGKNNNIHPELGANIHRAVELCGICGTEYTAGMVPMGIQNFKYQCPACGFVHYGEPEQDDQGVFRCSSCGQGDESFKMTELREGEPVKAGIGCCQRCEKKLGEDKIAFIEINDGSNGDRTGNVYFAKPTGKLKTAIEASESRSVFVEHTTAVKMALDKEQRQP